jgi:hypothetical protein
MHEKRNTTWQRRTKLVKDLKKSSAVKDSLWTTRFAIRFLEFIVGRRVFLPSTVGHVGQPKTSEPACAKGRSNKVYETVTGAVTVSAAGKLEID